MIYTVRLETARIVKGQAIFAPCREDETVCDEGTAEDVARDAASSAEIPDGTRWRILVFEDHAADAASPVTVLTDAQWLLRGIELCAAAMRDRDALIRAAMRPEMGISRREIAAAAGVQRGRLHQIVAAGRQR